MKIVQSLWTKPASRQGELVNYHGRWPHPRDFWFSWVISTGWAARHYGAVELVTDKLGASWLVDKLKLPFTSVRTDLDQLDVSGKLWAAGKIIAYDVQTEPFFHIDGDVYLTGKLPGRFEQADMLCQFFERVESYAGFRRIYDRSRLEIEQYVKGLPACWRFMSESVAGNCGIFGGRNLDAIHRYTRHVMTLLTDPQNKAAWQADYWKDSTNCVIEQQLLWCSAREQGVSITPIFEEDDFRDLQILADKVRQTNFNHAALEGKNPYFSQCLADHAQREFPDQFKIIGDLFPRTYVNLAMPSVVEGNGADETAAFPISQVELVNLPFLKRRN